MMCVNRIDDLDKCFVTGYVKSAPFHKEGMGSWWSKLKHFISSGCFMDKNVLMNFLKLNIGDVTFKEIYENTGFILNVSVSVNNELGCYRLLNYLTAPTVLVRSAVTASCAIPLFYPPVNLKCKDEQGRIKRFNEQGLNFIDGSMKCDLPKQKLAEMFNVNTFIVS